jgi:cob(I)alamin adenosyltransferase
MAKYFTATGDDGTTGILAGKRLKKSDKLVDAMGHVDELNSYLGIVLLHIGDKYIREEIIRIQNELFTIGSNLAASGNRALEIVYLDPEWTKRLEASIESLSSRLPKLDKFVIPRGSAPAAHLHYARAVARRLERQIVDASSEYKFDNSMVAYVNRLSSFLFVAAIYANNEDNVGEDNPTYIKGNK